MHSIRLLAVSLALVSFLACGDDDGGGGGAGGGTGGTPSNGGEGTGASDEGGGDFGGNGDGGGGGGFVPPVECNEFENVGELISETDDAGALPVMTGGPIVEGTYALTSLVVYGGDPPGVATHRETLVFTATEVESIISANDLMPTRGSATYVTAKNNLDYSFTCPAVVELSQQYTATGTTIALLSGSKVATYTLQ